MSPSSVRAAADAPAGRKHPADTRERILDIALRLFVDQGFDKTSLREIAEGMGFSKAALYYHFASKDDILLALHLRLHDVGRQALGRLGDGPTSVARWSTLMQELVGDLLAHRDLIVLHERNHAAVENLATKHQNADDHQDIQALMNNAISDRSIAHRDRIRLGAAIGAAFSGVMFAGNALEDIPIDDVAEQLRSAIRDLLTG